MKGWCADVSALEPWNCNLFFSKMRPFLPGNSQDASLCRTGCVVIGDTAVLAGLEAPNGANTGDFIRPDTFRKRTEMLRNDWPVGRGN